MSEKLSKYEKNKGLIAAKNVLFSSLGFVGTGLNEVLFEHVPRLKQKRLELFVDSWYDYVSKKIKKEIPMDYLESEDFCDFFEFMIKDVVSTRSEEKLELYKNIFTNQVFEPIEIDKAELYLEMVKELHPIQLQILNNLNLARGMDVGYTKHEIEELKKEIEELKKSKSEDSELSMLKVLNPSIGKHVSDIKQLGKGSKITGLEFDILKKEKFIEEYDRYFSHDYYNISIDEFRFFVNSLMSKGLISDLSPYSPKKNVFIFDLSPMGETLVDFMKINTK